MNLKEEFLNEITELTKNGKLKWLVGSGGGLTNLIVNPHLITKSFSVEYKNTDVYAITKKYVTYNTDLDQYEEKECNEVYILFGGIIRTTITSMNVSDFYMQNLFDVLTNSDETNVLQSLLSSDSKK